MAFFDDPFNDTISEEEMLKKIEAHLKNMKKDEIGTYIFVRGALDHREKLRELFMSSEEFPEKLREQYISFHQEEEKYIKKLDELKSALEPEKPKPEAYQLASNILADEEIRKRFEIDQYFPKRERLIYFHLEFLFNDDADYLMYEILPRLSKVKTKNIFSLFRFKLLDIGCYTKVEDDDDKDVQEKKLSYIQFCEKCIEGLTRFGNMKETEGVFSYIGIEEGKEKLFNLTIRLLLTIFEKNILNYLQLEITEEDIRFEEEIQKGFELIEFAKRVKKPLPTFEEAKELVEKLEKLRRFIGYANEYKLISTPQEKRLEKTAEEFIEIIEEAHKTSLQDDILEANKLVANQETSFEELEKEVGNPHIVSLRKDFLQIEILIRNVKRDRSLKEKRIEELMKDSEEGEPYYYRYINRVLYVIGFFTFDISQKMRDFLVETDKYGGRFHYGEDPLMRFYNSEESIKEYFDNSLKLLTTIHKKHFASLKRFDEGFELAKQMNSIILKMVATIKELNSRFDDLEK